MWTDHIRVKVVEVGVVAWTDLRNNRGHKKYSGIGFLVGSPRTSYNKI